jgi:hypothetical protein
VGQKLERKIRAGGFRENLAAGAREVQAVPPEHVVVPLLCRVGVHSVIVDLVARFGRQAKKR